jgi:general secretion pathway protein G
MKRWLKVLAFFLLLFLIVGGVFAGFFVRFTYSKYREHVIRAKEVALFQNLWTMRKAVEFYASDKEKRPQSLEELVSAGYLREIPADPFTGSNKTWIVEREKEPSAPSTPSGIINMRSAAAGADTNGKPYNQY